MAHITLSDEEIRIELSLWEKIFALTGDRTIPCSAVTEVALETDPLRSTRGMRAPGLGVPGSIKIGTWRGNDGGREIFPVGGHGCSPGTAMWLSPGTVMRFPV